jgi:hypothetical protein
MTTDEKLAIVSSMTGRNPFRTTPHYNKVAVDCVGITCHNGCPFYTTSIKVDSFCTAPRDNSPEHRKATVRTFRNALDNYPEYFL